MLSWLTGSSLAFTEDCNSTAKPGKKCILSDPIEDCTAEEFVEMFWKWVESKPPISSYQTDRKVTGTKADGMLESVDIEVSGLASLLVTLKATFYNKYLVEGDQLLIQQYMTDSSYKVLSNQTSIKLLKDPLRLEVVSEDFGTRKHGALLKGIIEGALIGAGFEGIKAEADVDSPSEPGQKSIIAGPVEDASMTSEGLWEKMKAKRLEDGGEPQADGSIKKEDAGWIANSTYSSLKFDKDLGCVINLDFGEDSTYSNVNATTYMKVINGPVRVEAWTVPRARVDSGKAAVDGTVKMYGEIRDAGSA
mmetsp:Transcript_18258/g.32078  ORF Transcript_18258/g.32078 Transcript_18258/m.32078 type:complete len:306 (+) Transcript_18258:55-972(+)